MQKLVLILAFLCAPACAHAWPGDVLNIHDGDTVRAGVVLLDDMIVLQDALISAGLAWVDDRFCHMAVCDLWRQHQADAKAARRGLWVDDGAALDMAKNSLNIKTKKAG